MGGSAPGRTSCRPIMSAAELADAGQPVRFTPHDFRRLFATDAVNGGLPLHIAAGLLGHLNLDTTCGDTKLSGNCI